MAFQRAGIRDERKHSNRGNHGYQCSGYDIEWVMDPYPYAGNSDGYSEYHPNGSCFPAEKPKGRTEGEKDHRMVTWEGVSDCFIDQLIDI
jgi:hypothetical protein